MSVKSTDVKIDLVDLAALPYAPDDERGIQVVTVRMPRSLHEELRRVAHRHQTSLNLLCISKLIAAIDNCPLVPEGPGNWRTEFAAVRDTKLITRRCRVCRCTEADCRGCIARTGQPCHWIEWDLCSACAGVAAKQTAGRVSVDRSEPHRAARRAVPRLRRPGRDAVP